MAIIPFITGKLYKPLGFICQTPSFQDFTTQELASDNFISTIRYTFELTSEVVLSGSTINESVGKCAVIAATEDAVVAYLQTVFSDINKDYTSNIYILSVTRKSSPITGVPTASQNSVYVSRFDTFIVDVRIDVKVTP